MPVNVTFVTLTAYQYLMTVPGYEAGIEFVHKQQADLRIKYVTIHRPELYSCEVFADHVTTLGAEYYYTQRTPRNLHVFMGPHCSRNELLLFAPLVKQWNVLLMSTSGSDPSLSNKAVNPTTLSLAPLSHAVLGLFLEKFLQTYKWSNVFLLCDDNTIGIYYRTVCGNLQQLLRPPKYHLNFTRFNSTNNAPVNYDLHLQLLKQFARVAIILARPDVTRQFLIHASRNNMTGDRYVYVHLYPQVQPPIFPSLFWKNGDSDDEVAHTAFAWLISLTFDNQRNVDSLPDESTYFILQRSKVYNITYAENEKISPVTVAGFESVLLATKVIQESMNGAIPLSDGQALARIFWNRTFDLPTGDMYINQNGDRFPNMLLRQWNLTVDRFEDAVMFDSVTRQLNNIRFAGLVWLGGQAPLNEPTCGYDGKKAICRQGLSNSELLIAVVVSLTLLVAVIVLGTWLVFRALTTAADRMNGWWRLSTINLTEIADVRFERPSLASRDRADLYEHGH